MGGWKPKILKGKMKPKKKKKKKRMKDVLQITEIMYQIDIFELA
jgi:hypothetical protein